MISVIYIIYYCFKKYDNNEFNNSDTLVYVMTTDNNDINNFMLH